MFYCNSSGKVSSLSSLKGHVLLSFKRINDNNSCHLPHKLLNNNSTGYFHLNTLLLVWTCSWDESTLSFPVFPSWSVGGVKPWLWWCDHLFCLMNEPELLPVTLTWWFQWLRGRALSSATDDEAFIPAAEWLSSLPPMLLKQQNQYWVLIGPTWWMLIRSRTSDCKANCNQNEKLETIGRQF